MNIQETMNAYKQGFIDGKKELQQENTQLKYNLRLLLQRMEEICVVPGGYDGEGNELYECQICGELNGHNTNCWLAAELDKLKGVE
jgi:hypothetical protein